MTIKNDVFRPVEMDEAEAKSETERLEIDGMCVAANR